jgi:hypothetical protein
VPEARLLSGFASPGPLLRYHHPRTYLFACLSSPADIVNQRRQSLPPFGSARAKEKEKKKKSHHAHAYNITLILGVLT